VRARSEYTSQELPYRGIFERRHTLLHRIRPIDLSANIAGTDNRVGIFLEDGHKNKAQAIELIQHFKDDREPLDFAGFDDDIRLIDGAEDPRTPRTTLGAIGFGSKDQMPPLQAADILGHCVYIASLERDLTFALRTIDFVAKTVPIYVLKLTPERIAESVVRAEYAEQEWHRFRKDVANAAKALEGTELRYAG
jgi:hypothetical protein